MIYATIESDNHLGVWVTPEEGQAITDFPGFVELDTTEDEIIALGVPSTELFVEDGKLVHSPTVEQQVADLQAKLSETDWVACKLMDLSLIGTNDECSDAETKYREVLTQRQEWRELVDQLQAELDKGASD